MGYTKDLWTRPDPDDKTKRIPNARWGKGKRWLACWNDGQGNEPTKAFSNYKAATKFWQGMETDVERGDYHDPKAGKEELAEVARRWLASRSVDPNTAISYESSWRRHIEPEFGRRPVSGIKPSEVQAFLVDLASRWPGAIPTARLVLGGVLELALADEMIRRNPARSSIISVATPPSERVVAWPDKAVFALIDAHPQHLRTMPTIGASCGLRIGELFGLAVEDIDDEVIRVRRQIKRVGTTYVYALPKNNRERIVPLSASTAEALKTHIRQHAPEPCTLPWEKPGGRQRTHRILFRWGDGHHMRLNVYDPGVWKPALVKAGLLPEPTKVKGHKVYEKTPNTGTHQLRHWYASVQLADGVNIRELAEYLGHSDPGFTLRVYGHLLPDSHERARRAIDARMFRPRVVSGGT